MEDPLHSTALFAADLNQDTPQLDLHGQRRQEALDNLALFLKMEILHGSDAIRIVHGRGNGVLQDAVHDLLDLEHRSGRILAFRDSHDPSRTGAVTIALLARKKRSKNDT